MAYRLRRPVDRGRGYANVVGRSRDGVRFETIATLTSVIAWFIPAAARILVIRCRPLCARRAYTVIPFGGGRVLMSADDRGVDADVPVDLAGGLRRSQHPPPGAVGGEAVMALPHRLPEPEPLRQITPRNPGPIPEHDPLDHLPVITKGLPRSRPTRAAAARSAATSHH
jgi:hypothetical protein